MKMRKQVYELTPGDLAAYPAWEFALDEEGEEGQDEATVRPVQKTGPIDPADGMCVVRTNFKLNDGSAYIGFLTPPVPGLPNLFPVEGDNGSGTMQPSIVTESGQVMFWYGILSPTADALTDSYHILGARPADAVFPIRFYTDVDIISGPVEGTIDGFMFVETVKCGFLKRKQVMRVRR